MTLQVKELINKNDSEKYQGRERLNALRSSSTVVLYHCAKSSNSIRTVYSRNITAICHRGDDRGPFNPLHQFDCRSDKATWTKGAPLQCKSVSLTFDWVLWSPLLLPEQKELVHCPTKAEVQELVSINLGTLFTGILKYDRPAPHIPCVLYILCRHMEPRKL